MGNKKMQVECTYYINPSIIVQIKVIYKNMKQSVCTSFNST